MKRFLIILAVVFVLAQFIRPNMTLPERDPQNDLITVTQPSAEVAALLRTSCYDCHSSETVYPWYVNITALNWWMQDHVNEGRKEFNMSDWASFSAERKLKKTKESVEMLESKEMPLPSYTWTHQDAKLNDAQRSSLISYFKGLHDALPALSADEPQ